MTEQASMKLTILYQDQFWVGIFERNDKAGYAVGKTIFGPEPTDPEVMQFILHEYHTIRFTTPSAEDKPPVREYKNPKRQMREVRQMQSKAPSISKAQDALRLEIEKNKLVSKKRSSEERRLEEQKQFEMKQAKKKEKLRGH
jgi:hypothetical protein